MRALLLTAVLVFATLSFSAVVANEGDGGGEGATPDHRYRVLCERLHDAARCAREAAKPIEERMPPTIQRFAAAHARRLVDRLDKNGLDFSVEAYLAEFRNRIKYDPASQLALCPDAAFRNADDVDKPFVPKLKELLALLRGDPITADAGGNAAKSVASKDVDASLRRHGVIVRALGLFRQYRHRWADRDRAFKMCYRAQLEAAGALGIHAHTDEL